MIVITMFCLYKGHQSSCCQVKIKSLLLVVLHIEIRDKSVSAVSGVFFRNVKWRYMLIFSFDIQHLTSTDKHILDSTFDCFGLLAYYI